MRAAGGVAILICMSKRLVCLAAASALVAGGSAIAARGPALAIVETEPLTVRGVNFSPYERVTVVVTTRSGASRPVRHSRIARTGVRGGFTLVLRGVTTGCVLAVTATSESGKRAFSPKVVPRCALP